jgi:hypothetical protein
MARGGWAMLGVLLLAGCADAGSAAHNLVSAGVAATVGSAVGSPLVGVAAGVAAAAGLEEGVKYGERAIHDEMQTAVATTAGGLEVGRAAPWSITSLLPMSGRHGVVQVARSFGEAIPCKDVVFTVDPDEDFYVTTICRGRDGWRWAAAEPTVRRWGGLQ